jgi:hypothetical protein
MLAALLPIIDKQAPVNKLTVRTVNSHRIDEECKNCMVERDGVVSNKSGCTSDCLTYCKLRKYVTKSTIIYVL